MSIAIRFALVLIHFRTEKVLIDFMPNLYVPLIGVGCFLSKFKLEINYPQNTFSLFLPQ